jgi:hypothetical protein
MWLANVHAHINIVRLAHISTAAGKHLWGNTTLFFHASIKQQACRGQILSCMISPYTHKHRHTNKLRLAYTHACKHTQTHMNPQTTTYTLFKRLMKDAVPGRYLFSRFVYIFWILGAVSHLMSSLSFIRFHLSESTHGGDNSRRAQSFTSAVSFYAFIVLGYLSSQLYCEGSSVPMFLLCFNVSLLSSAPSPSGLFDCVSGLLIL